MMEDGKSFVFSCYHLFMCRSTILAHFAQRLLCIQNLLYIQKKKKKSTINAHLNTTRLKHQQTLFN